MVFALLAALPLYSVLLGFVLLDEFAYSCRGSFGHLDTYHQSQGFSKIVGDLRKIGTVDGLDGLPDALGLDFDGDFGQHRSNDRTEFLFDAGCK